LRTRDRTDALGAAKGVMLPAVYVESNPDLQTRTVHGEFTRATW
jgi:hypothetical protein